MSRNNLKFNQQNANVKNPNHDAYWQAKGYAKRPDNWKQLYSGESKRQIKRSMRYPDDGRGFRFDSMFDPLCKDDY